MTEVVEQLKSQADGLSTAERTDLVSHLLATLDTDGRDEETWRAEIARRVADIRSGTAVGRPLDDVLAELRERYP